MTTTPSYGLRDRKYAKKCEKNKIYDIVYEVRYQAVYVENTLDHEI